MPPFCHNCIKGTSTQMVRCKKKCLWAWQEMVKGKSLYLEPAYQNFITAPSPNWLSRQARELLCESTSHVCRQRWGWAWSTAWVRESSCGDGLRGRGTAAAHYAWKCAKEEWAKLCFQRDHSAARCKACSRHISEDPSQALTLAEIRYGCRYFASAFASSFS